MKDGLGPMSQGPTSMIADVPTCSFRPWDHQVPQTLSFQVEEDALQTADSPFSGQLAAFPVLGVCDGHGMVMGGHARTPLFTA